MADVDKELDEAMRRVRLETALTTFSKESTEASRRMVARRWPLKKHITWNRIVKAFDWMVVAGSLVAFLYLVARMGLRLWGG